MIALLKIGTRQPYGSSYSGASFKFTVLDPTGARRSTQCASHLPGGSSVAPLTRF